MGISFGLLAILSTHLNSGQIEIFAAIVTVSLLGAIGLLERLPYERQ
jgi:hypothetical protein